MQYSYLTENFENKIKNDDTNCKDAVYHIVNCESCRNKLNNFWSIESLINKIIAFFKEKMKYIDKWNINVILLILIAYIMLLIYKKKSNN